MQLLKLYQCTLVGGFHSPMERECLEVLSRGRASVIFCPARGLKRIRLSSAMRTMLGEDRMVIVSPFAPDIRRGSRVLAQARNRFVGSLSTEVLVAHAAPGSSAEQFAREMLSISKPVLTIADPSNTSLLSLGAKILDPSVWSGSRSSLK